MNAPSSPAADRGAIDAPGALHARVAERIDEVEAREWNRVAGGDNPFVRHEFLSALERHGCVGGDSGWYPRHVLLYAGDRLRGAVPLYLKAHSFGEFGSDWAWAEAYARAGVAYYPKLVAAVPFTPATGPRLLHAAGDEDAAHALVTAALEVARGTRVSSLQWLFCSAEDCRVLEERGHARRTGCQYHWHNHGYRDFGDYLDHLNAKRRKQVRRERREAAQAPVEVEVLPGSEVSEAQWHAYHDLYSATYDRKWGFPSLTPGFFQEIGRTMGESVLLVLARRGKRYVAGAHLLRGRDTLFGRNWGCHEHHRCLHFEMCYYRGIEYCIDAGLATFEAGAQGEHKVWRGFAPVATLSAHWFRHREFRSAVDDFLEEERAHVARQIAYMREHLPFKGEA